jgi:acyl-CoA synthetase (AMP-forming)/AMP-acid ligase II
MDRDPDMMVLPLLAGAPLEAPLAWHAGRPLSRCGYLAEVQALARRLPAGGTMLNLSGDRYHFAVGLGAALVSGQDSLLPSNHTADTIERLRAQFAGVYGLTDADAPDWPLPLVRHAAELAAGRAASEPQGGSATSTPSPLAGPRDESVPLIPAQAVAARVLTSGSTGAPVPHAKPWGLLVRNIQAGARRLAQAMGRPSLEGVTLIATVPAQHMYGFESTVLIALLAGAAFDTERPFYPADIAAALARAPRPRMLVTTPFHLKTLLDAGVDLPTIDLTLCATAPLSPQLAARAEAALGAPLLEIYGCTEAGQVATRRTTAGAEWQCFDGLTLSGTGDAAVVSGGHVLEPTALADVLEVIDATHFRLLGRSNDLVNVAGKRSSLGHLNYHLNSIPGVDDGAFWLPPDDSSGAVVRLVAFVVASTLDRAALHDHVIAGLRERLDPAFLPRRVVAVAVLPREPGTAKLPVAPFGAWARQTLAGVSPAPADAAQQVVPPPAGPASVVRLSIPADHPAFAGHFPGQPLLPGVALLALVLEAVLDDPVLAPRLGTAPRLAAAKFLAPVRPGAQLTLALEAGPRGLRFELREGERVAASGHFEDAA